jgi:hypothetical protein
LENYKNVYDIFGPNKKLNSDMMDQMGGIGGGGIGGGMN